MRGPDLDGTMGPMDGTFAGIPMDDGTGMGPMDGMYGGEPAMQPSRGAPPTWVLVHGEELVCGPDGIPHSNGEACCHMSCGECGGVGCGSRPGGASACCLSHIDRAQDSCDSHGPPCVLSAAAATADGAGMHGNAAMDAAGMDPLMGTATGPPAMALWDSTMGGP